MIQIRNVPDNLHRKLKARAAQSGVSLSDYLLREAEVIAATPTLAELSERISSRGGVELSPSAAEIIRAQRSDR